MGNSAGPQQLEIFKILYLIFYFTPLSFYVFEKKKTTGDEDDVINKIGKRRAVFKEPKF